MYQIRPTTLLEKKVQYFIPKSKKKRIQKKAAKLYTKMVPDKETVIMDHINKVMYCHPETAIRLQKSLYSNIKEYG